MYLGVGVFFISFEEFIYFFLELFFTIIQNLFLYSKGLYWAVLYSSKVKQFGFIKL